jgi:hypothetical protein
MNEDAHRTWDIIFKWLGLVGILGSAWWTVHTYRESRTKDQNSFIFQHQATLYFDAARTAATLATSKDGKELRDATARFEQLYWGELVVVEDRRTELAMIAFRDCLTGTNCKRRSRNQYDKTLDSEIKIESDLPDLSLDLGACVRSALKKDRDIVFGEVTPVKTFCPYD